MSLLKYGKERSSLKMETFASVKQTTCHKRGRKKKSWVLNRIRTYDLPNTQDSHLESSVPEAFIINICFFFRFSHTQASWFVSTKQSLWR